MERHSQEQTQGETYDCGRLLCTMDRPVSMPTGWRDAIVHWCPQATHSSFATSKDNFKHKVMCSATYDGVRSTPNGSSKTAVGCPDNHPTPMRSCSRCHRIITKYALPPRGGRMLM